MRLLYLGLLVLLACGDDSGPTEPTVKPAVFELIDEGTGEPNSEPVWHLNAGSYIERSFSVESKHGAIYRVLSLAGGSSYTTREPYILDVQRWTKSEHGLALVSSVAQGDPAAPLVVLPPTIRAGMSWLTSDGFIASVAKGARTDTLVGSKTIWTVTLLRGEDGFTLEFIFAEGLGPYRPSQDMLGVIVLDDDSARESTFTLPTASTPAEFGSALDSAQPAIYGLAAIDVAEAPFVFAARSNYLPFGAEPSGFQDHDHCYIVGPDDGLTYSVERPESVPGDCPIRRVPVTGESVMVSSPSMSLPAGSGVIAWLPVKSDPDANGYANLVFSLPHWVDGQTRFFSRRLINASSYVGLLDAELTPIEPDIYEVYRTPHTGLYDETEGFLRVGLRFDSESGPMPFLSTADAWVTANALVGSQPGLSGESWFIPGRSSVRIHDAGREVFLTRPDGVVLKVDSDGAEIYTGLVAHSAPLSDGPYTGAVRHPSGITLSVSKPLSLEQTNPLVRVSPIDADIDLPPSFAFRALTEGNQVHVCYPKRFSELADLNLKVGGIAPTAIYPSGLADGCGLLVFEDLLVPNTAVEATLPGVGRILARTNDIINVTGTSYVGALPLRGGGFGTSRTIMNDGGVVTALPQTPRDATGDIGVIRDIGGNGHWTPTLGDNFYLVSYQLSTASGVDWPILPFKVGTRHTTNTVTSVSSEGLLYVCDKLPSDEMGCFSIASNGVLTTVPVAEAANILVVLNDGTKCYSNKFSGTVWCGVAAEPNDLPAVGAGRVVPQGSGFYVGAGFFDATTSIFSALTRPYEDIYLVDDDLVVGVYQNQVYRLEGGLETLVYTQEGGPNSSLLPGRNTVIIQGKPFPYDPTAN